MPTAIKLPPDMPSRMKRLPVDDVGRPVPWMVSWVDGVPDFRLADARKIVEAIRDELCFLCGQRLHRVHGASTPKGTFVAGPMCLVNRTSAEPPNHHECAEWSAKACPFLTKPAKVRRDGNLPDELFVAGTMIERNPGVTGLFMCNRWDIFSVPDGAGGKGVLFNMSHISNVQWMAEGRQATADEVMTSVNDGLPALIELADNQSDGMRALAHQLKIALRWVPRGSDIDAYPIVQRTLTWLP